MYSICGLTYSAEPALFLPVLVASCVYLIPTFVPWRWPALLVCCLFLAILVPTLADAFLWYTPDICDPPYFLLQLRQTSVVAALTLGIVVYFLIAVAPRPIVWPRTFRLRLFVRQYCIALGPASVLLLMRLV